MSGFYTSLVAGLTLLGTAVGYANPGTCTGTCTNTHDPSVVRRSDGTYFRFSTGGEIAVYTAPDLTGPWTYEGAAIAGGSSIDLAGNTDLWAPDVSLVGDTYYLYYAVSTFGVQDSAIGYATSTSLDVGTWTDHGSCGVRSYEGSSAYNAIDPNLVAAADGTYYLTFGSFWDDLYQVKMNSPPTSVASGTSSYQVADDPATTSEEGAFVYQYGEYYYLFYSAGQCCNLDTDPPAAGDEYHIMVCRSTSATGGYVDADGVACTEGGGTLVLESHDLVYAPGGQGVLDDPTYGAVLYYHYNDLTYGYSDADIYFGWNTIDFSSGWPVV
ncbi:glycoside hydrolase family 43 protein [Xylariaceae sp. FL0804]|nr:glycoside hydrolase family 43 protein [Xylariaceae sp. FL0804]